MFCAVQEPGRAGGTVVRRMARAMRHRGLHRRGLPSAVRRSGLRTGSEHATDGHSAGGLRELRGGTTERGCGRDHPAGGQEHCPAHGQPVRWRVRGVRRNGPIDGTASRNSVPTTDDDNRHREQEGRVCFHTVRRPVSEFSFSYSPKI